MASKVPKKEAERGRRPIELTPEMIDKLIDAVGKGITRRNLAPVVGVSIPTFFDWLNKGRDGEKPFVELLKRLEAAEAARRSVLEITVGDRAATDPAMALDVLQRIDPDTWAKKDRVVIERGIQTQLDSMLKTLPSSLRQTLDDKALTSIKLALETNNTDSLAGIIYREVVRALAFSRRQSGS